MPKFVIGGVEHSGTTLLSDIFRQVPGLDSGFEVGVLLCNTPKEFRTFKPFIDQMPAGWGLTEEDLDYICDTDSFQDFYERLYEKSQIIKKPCEIFDKTPRYAWGIEKCISNYPDGKYILTYKDPRALFYSNYKRYGENVNFKDFIENNLPKSIKYWLKIYENYQKIKKEEIKGNFLIVSLEEITFDCRKTLEKIFEFVGLEFNLDYLLLRNLRYRHTRADYISAKIALEYRFKLKKEEIKIITQELGGILNEWFYE
ncbi:sulfotransferase family protein [Thermodesulfovibrio aggregans]|nr:sulfotransferase [Thermodesulfovibrio aggregans]